MNRPSADRRGNVEAREGQDRCACGCKYWARDRCIDCGEHVRNTPDNSPEAVEQRRQMFAGWGWPTG